MQDFFKFFMPAVHNDLESAKYQANKGDPKRAHECLDAMEDKLNKAQKQTEEEIKKRDTERWQRTHLKPLIVSTLV